MSKFIDAATGLLMESSLQGEDRVLTVFDSEGLPKARVVLPKKETFHGPAITHLRTLGIGTGCPLHDIWTDETIAIAERSLTEPIRF